MKGGTRPERAVDLLFEAEAAGVARRDGRGRAALAETNPRWHPCTLTRRRCPRRHRARRAHRRADRFASAGLDTGPVARGGPCHSAGCGVGTAARRRRAGAGRRRRGGSAGQGAVHRRVARLRQWGAGPDHVGDTANPRGRQAVRGRREP
ncbi:hypothetical protein I553_10162 [Mycobacterium xenopi 4042]|uniref:Uncharacterized protein n=1 Tax=Mycobacterium xenopi 4042 TaxID=1299334 RepID=X7ZM97_MYCXE|nr:hypothetical protein I553_10162 [Mycobacterium xenopi 4042]